ncbi:MAG: hypothetical protein ABIT38_10425 [Gemmatimonadaceae bacterium]
MNRAPVRRPSAEPARRFANDRRTVVRIIAAILGVCLLFVAPYSYTLADASAGGASGSGEYSGVHWHSIFDGSPNALSLATATGHVPSGMASESLEMRAYLLSSFELTRWDVNLGLLLLQWSVFALLVWAADNLIFRFLLSRGKGKAGRRA